MCRKQTTLCQYIGKLGGIDRAATIEKFGYDPDTLSRGSGRRVVAVCEGCGKVRDLEKKRYRELCRSCGAKKYFEDPEIRKRYSVRQKKRFEDPEIRKRHSAAQKKRFEDPIEVMKSSERVKKRYEDPKAHEKLCIAAKKRWKKPEEHVKSSVAQKKRYENPETRRKASEAAKKRFRDNPKAHEKASDATKKYFKNNPYTFEDRKRISARIQNIPYEEWKSFAKDAPYCPKFNEACRESNREKYCLSETIK